IRLLRCTSRPSRASRSAARPPKPLPSVPPRPLTRASTIDLLRGTGTSFPPITARRPALLAVPALTSTPPCLSPTSRTQPFPYSRTRLHPITIWTTTPPLGHAATKPPTSHLHFSQHQATRPDQPRQ
ncbi:MAG: hypothetical protein Q9180_007418, partial [Flavoplaca navasiana]